MFIIYQKEQFFISKIVYISTRDKRDLKPRKPIHIRDTRIEIFKQHTYLLIYFTYFHALHTGGMKKHSFQRLKQLSLFFCLQLVATVKSFVLNSKNG